MEKISKGLSKAKRRLVEKILYGIQLSKDVKLSNTSRALKENIPLIKTKDRLNRNTGDEDLTPHINNYIMRLGDDKIDDTMVIAIDPGDLVKPYVLKKWRIYVIIMMGVNMKQQEAIIFVK